MVSANITFGSPSGTLRKGESYAIMYIQRQGTTRVTIIQDYIYQAHDGRWDGRIPVTEEDILIMTTWNSSTVTNLKFIGRAMVQGDEE